VNTAIVKVSNLVTKLQKFEDDRKERKKERQARRDSIKKAKQNSGN